MKSEFKAIPVFLKKDNRIEAHFITFFVLLIIYRRLNDKFTCHLILIQTKITHENPKLDFRGFHGGGEGSAASILSYGPDYILFCELMFLQNPGIL